MGLSTISYSKIEPINIKDALEAANLFDYDDVEDFMCENNIVEMFCYSVFEEHALEGFEIRKRVNLNSDFGLTYGPYVAVSGNKVRTQNSYPGHSKYRDLLRQLFGADGTNPDSPFYELVNFADNEGTLGTSACAKLREDYLKYPEMVGDFDSFYGKLHKKWYDSVLNAADNGIILFR